MKKLLIKFANWILRRYIPSVFSFDEDVYVDGHAYELKAASWRINPPGGGETTLVLRDRKE